MNLLNFKKWMVVGPGRTGSGFIVDVILNYYSKQKQIITYVGPPASYDIKRIDEKINLVIHTHSIESFLKYKDKCDHIILSTRNMVDSAISWLIQREIGMWHIYDTNQLKTVEHNRVKKPFDYDFFLNQYGNAKWFYETIKPHINNSVITIDYQEIYNGPNHIINLLNLCNTSDTSKFRLPIKNPGLPQEWFTNWEEISEKIVSLNKNPPL
jgi:hypothetical protein